MEMKRHQLVILITCFLLAAISLLMSMSSMTLARQRGGPPNGPKDLKAQQHEQDRREASLRTSETGVAIAKIDQRRIEGAIKQLQEDFRRIQIVRNEMVRNLLSNKPLDYKLISDEVGEINKRADRLKSYLMPPVPEDKEKDQKNQAELNDEEMKGALVLLCNRIIGFVENPVLKTPGITDVEQSARAGGDLLSIIELSGNIKRSAEKLSKAVK
jgi:hypothetical protein